MTSSGITGPTAGHGVGTAEVPVITDVAPRVVWTRNGQFRAVAEVIAGDRATRTGPDLVASCIEARASLLVTRRLSSFDMCNVAVPHAYSEGTVRSVVAAVGGGPHTALAAAVAQRIADRLAVPGRAVFGHDGSEVASDADGVLGMVAEIAPRLTPEVVQVSTPAAMVEGLARGALLVVGAPGGSWFQRQFFGPGARIRSSAPGGTIVVRHAPSRVYQVMRLPTAYGPHMRLADAVLLSDARPVIVARDGLLLGIVSNEALDRARPDLELRDVMEPSVFVTADETIRDAAEVARFREGEQVPVVDQANRLVGIVTSGCLRRSPLI